ncbi:MAG: hypothetical protein NTAFB01_33130 [Nitrospira sp.]
MPRIRAAAPHIARKVAWPLSFLTSEAWEYGNMVDVNDVQNGWFRPDDQEADGRGLDGHGFSKAMRLLLPDHEAERGAGELVGLAQLILQVPNV